MDFDLQTLYKRFEGVLPDAKIGEVVTRFAPEPSGYLHIGHAKAALLSYHYAQMYKGKVILRFDDTNPANEKEEYVQSILEDLKTLGFKWDIFSHTSDYFDKFQDICTDLIKKGIFYCDNTPTEQMREERGNGIESKWRNTSPEENLRIWINLQQGLKDEKCDYTKYCVRAKIDMQQPNKCMRDPVMYRYNELPHQKTGTKYKVYPTYDFACPIIDSIEGVTHAMRANEYSDRIEQFK